jgi:hypothetical protein
MSLNVGEKSDKHSSGVEKSSATNEGPKVTTGIFGNRTFGQSNSAKISDPFKGNHVDLVQNFKDQKACILDK